VFCWERKSWTSALVVDLLQQKGLGCWKVLKKRCKQKGKLFPQLTNSMVLAKWKSMHLVLNMFIFTRTLVTYARTIFKPRCCLNFQSMRTQAEFTDIAHNMFGQIKMEIPWYNSRHTLISRKKGWQTKNYKWPICCCAWLLGSTNSASLQTPLILCFKSAVNSCMGIARPVWTARTYNSRPRSPWKALSNWAVQQALERGCKLRSAWTTLHKVSLWN